MFFSIFAKIYYSVKNESNRQDKGFEGKELLV